MAATHQLEESLLLFYQLPYFVNKGIDGEGGLNKVIPVAGGKLVLLLFLLADDYDLIHFLRLGFPDLIANALGAVIELNTDMRIHKLFPDFFGVITIAVSDGNQLYLHRA